ncbi:MAG: type II toxin-antitoxin system HicA family toxin [bacterium]
MPKQARLTAREAESLLLKHGFSHARSKGSHRIYMKGSVRLIIPFHTGKILHPKIVKEIMQAVADNEM